MTPVGAEVRPGVAAAEVVAALHPTPAVNGWPSAPALDFIQAVEGLDRGVYAGPVGVFEHGQADFDVGLRGALLTAHGTRIFAGSGVVAGSTVAGEVAETAAKALAVARALGFEIPDRVEGDP